MKHQEEDNNIDHGVGSPDHFHSLSLNILFLFSFPLLFVTENDQQNRPRDQQDFEKRALFVSK